MSPEWTRTAKSAEKIIDSSSDDEVPLPSPTLLERSSSPASSSSSISSSPSSPVLSVSNSPTRSPSPDSQVYRYQPPSTHELSLSKGKSMLPPLRSNEDLVYIRFPAGISLETAEFNLRERKARIGEEEWQLLEEEVGDIRVIQPREGSENFELANSSLRMGFSLARRVDVPKAAVPSAEADPKLQKRKRTEEEDEGNSQKTKDKEGKHHHKEKHRDKQRKDKSDSKERKHKSEKHKNRHS